MESQTPPEGLDLNNHSKSWEPTPPDFISESAAESTWGIPTVHSIACCQSLHCLFYKKLITWPSLMVYTFSPSIHKAVAERACILRPAWSA